tara:strand:- start:193 stop:675 length:483 start_codon:yes stop_codon:yes gene_type:complete
MSEEISVSFALQLKNQLKGDISELMDKLRMNNSYGTDTELPSSLRGMVWADLQTLTSDLIVLKNLISAFNVESGNQYDIYRLDELKGMLVYLKMLDTTSGQVPDDRFSYAKEPTFRDMSCIMSQDNVDEQIASIKDEITQLQAAIDKRNSTGKILFSIKS